MDEDNHHEYVEEAFSDVAMAAQRYATDSLYTSNFGITDFPIDTIRIADFNQLAYQVSNNNSSLWNISTNPQAEEMASLRAEINSLKQELAEIKALLQPRAKTYTEHRKIAI
jgi:hypothetical protein